MIIDTHTHLGRDAATINAYAEELIKSMDAAHIDKALVYSGTINGCSNDWLLEQIAPYAGRLYAVVSTSPFAPMLTPPQIADLIREKRIVAMKFYPGYEYFHPQDHCLRQYLEVLSELGVPAIFHSGDLYSKVRKAKLKYAHPLHIDDLATDMPDLKIVIAHLGYPWMLDAAQVCSKNANVYADLSGLVCGDFDLNSVSDIRDYLSEFARICRDPSKVMFGTDWPVCEQAGYVRCMPGHVSFIYGTKAVEPIMSGNAIRIFGL